MLNKRSFIFIAALCLGTTLGLFSCDRETVDPPSEKEDSAPPSKNNSEEKKSTGAQKEEKPELVSSKSREELVQLCIQEANRFLETHKLNIGDRYECEDSDEKIELNDPEADCKAIILDKEMGWENCGMHLKDFHKCVDPSTHCETPGHERCVRLIEGCHKDALEES